MHKEEYFHKQSEPSICIRLYSKVRETHLYLKSARKQLQATANVSEQILI